MLLNPQQSKDLIKLSKDLVGSKNKKYYRMITNEDDESKLVMKKWYGGSEESNRLSYTENWTLGKTRKNKIKWIECNLTDLKVDGKLINLSRITSFDELVEVLVNRISVQSSSSNVDEELPARMVNTLLIRSLSTLSTLMNLGLNDIVIGSLKSPTIFSFPSDCLNTIIEKSLLDVDNYLSCYSDTSVNLIDADPKSEKFSEHWNLLLSIPSYKSSLDEMGVSLSW